MEQNIDNNAEAQSTVNVKDLIWMCLSRWYWFVLSLFICCGAGIFYILSTPKVYERSAQVLVRDDKKSGGGSSVDISQAFQSFGMLGSSANVQNELLCLTSPAVIYEVVNRLGLDVDYKTPGLFHDVTLYGPTLPLTFAFPDMEETQVASFEAVVKPDGKVDLSDFIMVDQEGNENKIDSKTLRVSYEDFDTISSPIGRIAIAPNPTFKGPLKENLPIEVTKMNRRTVASNYNKNISAEIPDKSEVIEVHYSDVSIPRAEDVINAMIDVYNENWVRDRNRIAVSTSEFIKERLGVIESELGNVDTDISSFKAEHMLPDVEEVSKLYINRSAVAEDKLLELNNRLQMATYIKNYLANSTNAFSVLPANTGLEDFSIEQQIGEYNTTVLRRNNLVDNSSTQNPLVVEMDSQIAGMRQSIIQAVDNYIVTMREQVAAAQGTKAATTSRLRSSPTQARYLLSVERQQKVKEALYLFLLQKREDNELSQAFTAYNTRVILPPNGDFIPTLPNKRNVMLVSVLLGLLIPFGLIYLNESMNTKVRGRKDIESLSLPFLGELPLSYRRRRGLALLRKAHEDEKEKRVIVIKKGKGNVINEAFRVVRANLELMADAERTGAHVIMLTSANPGSGKTFITMNLAMVLAVKGKKVAVIDLDLRKTSLSSFVGTPPIGVSSYLAGHATLQEIVKQVPVEAVVHQHHRDGTPLTEEEKAKRAEKAENLGHVDIYPGGAIPPNPSEMLYSPRLKAMIDKLEQEYDYVLLDCPPVEVVADAQIINNLAQMTIFVIRAGVFERDMLPSVEAFYRERRYKNMALILNGTEPQARGPLHTSYGYGYGYGYGYSYGYGHSQDK